MLTLLLLPGCLNAFGCGSWGEAGTEELSFTTEDGSASFAMHLLLIPPEPTTGELYYELALRNLGAEPCGVALYELPGVASPDAVPAVGEDWAGQAPVAVDRLLPAELYTTELLLWGQPEPAAEGAFDLSLALVTCGASRVEGELFLDGSFYGESLRCDAFDSAELTWSVERLW